MKKVFIFCSIIALGLFASCSNDQNTEESENALIGSWQLVAEYDNNEPYELTTCELEQTIVFKADNSYQYISYSPTDDEGSECAVDDYSTLGDWSITSKGKMMISDDYIEIEVNYTVSGDTFTMSYTDSDDGEDYTVKSVYTKI